MVAKTIMRKKNFTIGTSPRLAFEGIKSFKTYLDEAISRQIDPKEYPKMNGLEGPFYFDKNDIVLYYDPKEGAYYDIKTDRYTSKNFNPMEKQSSGNSMWEQIQEGSRSSQGTLFQAMGMIENSQYIRKGTVVGNSKTKSISFKMNDGTDITINNVVYKKNKQRFCYDEILGAEEDFNRVADIINTLNEIGIYFNTDEK